VGEQEVAVGGRKFGQGSPEGPVLLRIEHRLVRTARCPVVVHVAFVPSVPCGCSLLVANQVSSDDDGISRH
jgi:hypothetical protein